MKKAVKLKVISNDGDIAICEASIGSKVVDMVEFEREEDTVEGFLKAFPIGHAQTGQQIATNEEEYDAMRTLTLQSRLQGRK